MESDVMRIFIWKNKGFLVEADWEDFNYYNKSGYYRPNQRTFGFFISAMELVGTPYRIFAGIVVFYFSALGYVMLAAIAYLSRNWSYTQIAISAPALLILSYFW